MLGDFNRNLAHEKNRITENNVRTDGSDPKSALPNGTLVRSLLGEINDSSPEQSALTLLDPECPVNSIAKDICSRSKNEFFSQEALKPLTKANSLGCRNPIGLDQILVSSAVALAGPAMKIAVGPLGGTKPASKKHSDPLLAISDHCPLKAAFTF